MAFSNNNYTGSPSTPVTLHLIIINVVMLIADNVFRSKGINLTQLLGLHYYDAPNYHVWQSFTYMFMHANFTHLFFNMFAVWMFGRILEHVWGEKRFLFYYLACGIGAGLIQELVQYIQWVTDLSAYQSVNLGYTVIPMSEYLNMMNTVGASGAVYGILLGFGMYFPNQEMYVFPLPFAIKAKYFVIIYALLEIVLGATANDHIAHYAHLGGMIFGFIIIMYWRHKRPKNGFYDFR